MLLNPLQAGEKGMRGEEEGRFKISGRGPPLSLVIPRGKGVHKTVP